jgi:hypothetical protein
MHTIALGGLREGLHGFAIDQDSPFCNVVGSRQLNANLGAVHRKIHSGAEQFRNDFKLPNEEVCLRGNVDSD